MKSLALESFTTFGDLLRYLRQREQLTQRELSIAVGYSESQINRLEHNLRLPEPSVIAAQFIPALHLEDEPEVAARLIELAAEARGEIGIPIRKRRTNLPAQVTSFIGREREIAELTTRVKTTRLLTLMGAGGVGKTRLALEIASTVDDVFADGVWLVEFAPILDAELVTQAVAAVLGVSERLGSLLLEVLTDFLRGKRMLLVLDNCEHLIEACARLADALLRADPNLTLLATSREAFGIDGEVRYRVPSLSCPDPQRLPPIEELFQFEAVRLFIDRASAVAPAFKVTTRNARPLVQVCHRLDGIPLAIELAAARSSLLPVKQIAARLDDRFHLLTGGSRTALPRHKTLRALIDWSYNLLTSEEQMLFRRLGVFVGGCTLEAIEQVASEGLSTPVIDLMQSLADKSLVKVESRDGEPRFSLLETLHEYAVERLEQGGELQTLRKRHAEYFAAYAERVEPTFVFLEQADWIEQLNRERDNLAAAFAEARRMDDAMLQTRFIAATRTWLMRLPDPEDWAWLPKLFAQPEARANPFKYAKALNCGGLFIGWGDSAVDNAQRFNWLQNATSIFESLGETVWQAESLVRLGNAAWGQGMLALAEQYCAQSALLFEDAGEKQRAAYALVWTAVVRRDQGHLAEAERLFKQCRTMFHDLRDRTEEGNAVNGLADLEFIRGDYEAANAYYDEVHELWRGTAWQEFALRGKGRVAYVQGRVLEASGLLETCIVDVRNRMNVDALSWTLHHLAFVAHILNDDARAHELLREALTLQHKRVHGIVISESLERYAWIVADQQRHLRAARLFGVAAAMRENMGTIFPRGDMPLHEPRLQAVRAALDEATFTALWNEGRAMSLNQAVEYAFADDA